MEDRQRSLCPFCLALMSTPPSLYSRVLMQKVAKELLGMISWPAVQVITLLSAIVSRSRSRSTLISL